MNSRPHAYEILDLFMKLQTYLSQDDVEGYTVNQIKAHLDEVVKDNVLNQQPSETFWPILNEVKRKLFEQFKGLPLDGMQRLTPAAIENAMVRVLYSHFFEQTFTYEQLMSLNPGKSKNQILEDYQKEKFFYKGEGGERQLLVDLERELLVNERKIEALYEFEKINIDENMKNKILAAHSQLPSYILPNLIGMSLVSNNQMMFQPNKAKRKLGLKTNNNDLFLEVDLRSIKLMNMSTGELINTFDGAHARFKYEKSINPDQSLSEGYRLIDITASDPYMILVLSQGQEYTEQQLMEYINKKYPEISSKMNAGNARMTDLYSELLLFDIKQKINLFAKGGGVDGIDELIKLNSAPGIASGVVNLEAVANVCYKRLDNKPSNKNSLFSKKPVFRDPGVHLFYQACSSYKDILTWYPNIVSLEQLMDGQQKVEMYLKLSKELSNRTSKNESETIQLMEAIKKSSPSQSCSSILKNSKLKEKLIEPNAVIEKISAEKKNVFNFK